MRLPDPQDQFAVYLLDPGPQGPGVLTLLQEITGGSTSQCAQMVQTSPAFVTACRTRAAAEDLVARLREFDAVAVVRPMSQPLAEGDRSDPLGTDSLPAVPWLLAGLAVLQLLAALWWLLDGKLLSGIGGLLLGAIVLTASIVTLSRARR
jgi:hypothetical protein